jgi:hypothetical protein
MCSLLSLVMYPKRAHFASRTLSTKYWGARMAHPPEQVQNHNLDSVAVNYPCPISRLRVVSHNRTKHREVGLVSRITFLPIVPM